MRGKDRTEERDDWIGCDGNETFIRRSTGGRMVGQTGQEWKRRRKGEFS